MVNPFLVMALLWLAFPVAANQQTHFDHAAQAAKSLNQRPPLLDMSEYCQGADCQAITHPPQTQYLNHADTLKAAAQHKVATDETARHLLSSNKTRTRVQIDPNDPVYHAAKDDIKDAWEIAHGVKGKYTDCTTHSRCSTTATTKQCSEPVNHQPSCTLTRVPLDVQVQQHTHVFPINGRLPTMTLPGRVWVTRIELPALHTAPINEPEAWCKEGRATIATQQPLRVNGLPTTPTPGAEHFTLEPSGPFEHTWVCKVSSTTTPTVIHFSPPKAMSQLSLQLANTPKPLMGQGRIVVHSQVKHINLGWHSTCTAMPPICNQQTEHCVEGAGTRTLRGVPIYQACWKKKRTYQCHYPDTCASIAYTSANPTQCRRTQTQCAVSLLGVCVKNTVQLSCRTTTCQQAPLSCGEPAFCLDGECYGEKGTHNPNASQAIAALAAVGEGANELNKDTLTTFSGIPRTCSKKPIGIANCCSLKGWGKKVGLAKCSDEERALLKAKEKKTALYVGSYCAEKVLGICIRHKESYCEFTNKLARIINEQGRPQLGISFGQADAPRCNGLTPKQLSQIDFSAIDFSAFYDDIKNKTQLPDTNAIKQRIAAHYKDKK